jgi:hypothetical protein
MLNGWCCAGWFNSGWSTPIVVVTLRLHPIRRILARFTCILGQSCAGREIIEDSSLTLTPVPVSAGSDGDFPLPSGSAGGGMED